MDKYFEFKYYSEMAVLWVSAFIIILLFIGVVVWQIFLLIKKIVIDAFMKKQGYILKSRYNQNVWVDGNTYLEFQKVLYNRSFQDIKVKYEKKV